MRSGTRRGGEEWESVGASRKDGERSQREMGKELDRGAERKTSKKGNKNKSKSKDWVSVNLGPLRRESRARTGLDGFRCLVHSSSVVSFVFALLLGERVRSPRLPCVMKVSVTPGTASQHAGQVRKQRSGWSYVLPLSFFPPSPRTLGHPVHICCGGIIPS